MYEYKFIEARTTGLFKESNHRQLINEHSKDGWRFVSVIETENNGHGVPKGFDLIFEKKIDY